MSYVFTIQADSKEDATTKLTAAFDNVLATQPAHEVSLPPARVAAEAYLDLLCEPREGQEIRVCVDGYLGWRDAGEYDDLRVTITAVLTERVDP